MFRENLHLKLVCVQSKYNLIIIITIQVDDLEISHLEVTVSLTFRNDCISAPLSAIAFFHVKMFPNNVCVSIFFTVLFCVAAQRINLILFIQDTVTAMISSGVTENSEETVTAMISSEVTENSEDLVLERNMVCVKRLEAS